MTSNSGWIAERAVQPPTILAHWDGLPTITLSKLGGGARLLWIFDDFDEVQHGAFVRLTGEEAQAVYDTAPDVGLLEMVRRTLADRTAYVWRTSGGSRFEVGIVEIPSDGSEYEFSTFLLGAAMSLEETATPPELERLRRSAEEAVALTLGAAA